MKKVAVIMGSDSDWPVVKGACQQLAAFEGGHLRELGARVTLEEGEDISAHG